MYFRVKITRYLAAVSEIVISYKYLESRIRDKRRNYVGDSV